VRLTWRNLPFLLRRTVLAAVDDNLFGIAKGAAYSALLSFFPVLASFATIMLQTRAEFVTRTLQSFLSRIVPPGAEDLVIEQFRLEGERPTFLPVFAILLSVWSASRVISSLIEGFQAAYRVPRSRGILRDATVTTALVLLAVLPAIGASALVLFGTQFEILVLRWIARDPYLVRLSPVWFLVSRLALYGLSFTATVGVTMILYYFGPYRRQRWRAVFPGAVLATMLWLVATGGFAWYVRNLANYNVLYGSIGTSIALLVWMYLMTAIALLGCEFNAEIERLTRV
jgi:membrane protein